MDCLTHFVREMTILGQLWQTGTRFNPHFVFSKFTFDAQNTLEHCPSSGRGLSLICRYCSFGLEAFERVNTLWELTGGFATYTIVGYEMSFLFLVKLPCCLLCIERISPVAFAALERIEKPLIRMVHWIEARVEGNEAENGFEAGGA